MTSIDTWSPWLAVIITGGPGLLGLASILYSLYLSRRHLDAMKDALKNSRYIYLWGSSLGKRGLIWSLLEIATITGMVIWPKAYIQMGDVNSADLENFPPHLKRFLIIDITMKIVAFSWMAAVAVLLKFR
ncbi:hypothetical protein OOJ96_19135 [Pseudomonas sp. 15FMM2]|uniref:Uncharacterized protein n=1 Tax=Pseudomonas imrae TaxID=2992837 RepID=A0ACC7PP84_9PSED